MQATFLDTNILLYLASNDAAKAEKAEAVLAAGGEISVQVLNELTSVLRRKMGMSWNDTTAFLKLITALVTVHAMTVDTHQTGVALAQRYALSIYDAMIVASALNAGCANLLSEDMQHGLLIDNKLRVLNPFRQAA